MTVTAIVRPDGRSVLRARGGWSAAAAAEAVAIAERSGRSMLVVVDEDDRAHRRALESVGFRLSRTESTVEIALPDAIRALAGSRLPHGIEERAATDVDPDALWRLDDELRGDVPGTDGWRSSPEAFRAETFADTAFDPRTYRVAVDGASLDPIAIVRIWMNPTGPRIGLWGVRRTHRGRGIASALLRSALVSAHAIDPRPATTEIDVANAPSLALARRIGAREVRRLLELRYSAPG